MVPTDVRDCGRPGTAILRLSSWFGRVGAMSARSDDEALDAILISCQYLHVKLDRILRYIEDDGEEEEEDEPDG
jgi:hypothetical protein